MTSTNPFTERSRITSPERFAGRWAELSLIFERLEGGRPVLVVGPPGIGKSSLLTHIVQSAAVNLELPELRAYYLDLAGATDASEVYRTVVGALGQRGENAAALEVALLGAGDPVLLCLDNAQAPLAAGWGAALLESLARVARGGALALVAAVEGRAPELSERFATISLGALAQTEVRLLVDAYLDDVEGVRFTPAELREIADVSAGHPAYVQRAAFHLFQSKIDPSIDWRAAYLVEARTRPVPGAPLPPAVFAGQSQGRLQSAYGDEHYAGSNAAPQQRALPETPPVLPFAVVLAGAIVLALTRNLAFALATVVVAGLGVFLWSRRR